MPIYRVLEPRLGRRQMREWRRRALHTLGLLLLALVGCTVGLFFLEPSDEPLNRRAFTALWNAANLVTTLGDFTGLNEGQKTFMTGAMFTFLIIGGYAVSQLTGMLSSDAVMAHRENRAMKRTLDRLANHVIVIGFGPRGQLVAGRLQAAGDLVVVIVRHDDLVGQASELGYLVVQGAGADDGVLYRARIESAKALVVTTEDADRNLAITLMAHAVNPKLKIAVTGQNSKRGALLQRAGASEVVIADELIAGALIGRLGEPPIA